VATRKPDLVKQKVRGRKESPFSTEEQRVLKKVIGKELSKIERAIVLMYYGEEELTVEEIAAVLDLSMKKARMYFLAAFIKMRMGIYLATRT
jgi:DNA-directed RNA polymerase specialized sigma subunit